MALAYRQLGASQTWVLIYEREIYPANVLGVIYER
jgi:hypothetical protein